jgi:hypothetical protein
MFSPQLEEPRTEYVFLIQMINLSGNSFTPDFLAKCANRDEYFDQQGATVIGHLRMGSNLPHSIYRELEASFHSSQVFSKS